MKLKHMLLALGLVSLGSTTAFAETEPESETQESPTLLRRAVGEKAPEWAKDVADRIQLHGYAQGGYNYSRKGDTNSNTFEIKRVLFWANAQITDRWSFLFMHDFSSVVQEYYTDFRITRNKALTVRLGQFKNGLFSPDVAVTHLWECSTDATSDYPSSEKPTTGNYGTNSKS